MKTTPKPTAPVKTMRMPERCEVEAQHIHDARCKSVKLLGKNWQLHPDYVFNPRHSNNEGIYIEARQPYIELVAKLAAADSEKRPAFIRAQAVRNALGVV